MYAVLCLAADGTGALVQLEPWEGATASALIAVRADGRDGASTLAVSVALSRSDAELHPP
jgi:hypothetical protein